ncbi:MAG TPA: hypothetical protein VFO60_00945, partial [Candidatus Dormibacteraeota bacterium]|nr:hypothetical protein [Candidatus Dormibacteraeota bacterium]
MIGKASTPWRWVLVTLGGLVLLGGLLAAVPGNGAAATGTILVVGTKTDDGTLQTCSATANANCSLRGAVEIARHDNATAYTIEAAPGLYPMTEGALGIASSVTLKS